MWRAAIRIRAPREQVVSRLEDAASLPRWNPAISSVGRATRRADGGTEYRVRIRGILPAALITRPLRDGLMEYELEGLGSRECRAWRVTAIDDRTTDVVHEFEHSGTLLAWNSAAFADVAQWRLERLKHLCERA